MFLIRKFSNIDETHYIHPQDITTFKMLSFLIHYLLFLANLFESKS